MRQTYTVNRSSEQAFKNALNSDLGVYSVNNQTGFGIGGFLKKMFGHINAITVNGALLWYLQSAKTVLLKILCWILSI